MTEAWQKTVWITRTLPGANASAADFEAAGFKTIIAPLLKVETLRLKDAVPNNAVLIFTSQNAVRAFCEDDPRREFPVVTVGGATAALARAFGFKDVISAKGTSDDIAPLVANAPNHDALYLHMSGQHVRGFVSEDLRAMGLKAERSICYHSKPVTDLPGIDMTQIDVVALFSPLAAQTLAQLAPDTPHVSALSISSAADAALSEIVFKDRIIATVPTLESMIAALTPTG